MTTAASNMDATVLLICKPIFPWGKISLTTQDTDFQNFRE